MSKATRQQRILQLVGNGHAISSQDELRRELARGGFEVTQATLSRDITDLGLVKTGDGYRVPEGYAPRPLPSLERLLREFVVEMKPAANLLVLKTAPGSAQPVAAALDAEGWAEIVGTIGGDDTLLVVSSSPAQSRRVAARIREALA
ncbi:MAG: ArgR family transcriptional regulator [Acidobacteria bacterium]|nr:ArgR family transcriptional regulator [Acidobacteriota bacterium]